MKPTKLPGREAGADVTAVDRYIEERNKAWEIGKEIIKQARLAENPEE